MEGRRQSIGGIVLPMTGNEAAYSISYNYLKHFEHHGGICNSIPHMYTVELMPTRRLSECYNEITKLCACTRSHIPLLNILLLGGL